MGNLNICNSLNAYSLLAVPPNGKRTRFQLFSLRDTKSMAACSMWPQVVFLCLKKSTFLIYLIMLLFHQPRTKSLITTQVRSQALHSSLDSKAKSLLAYQHRNSLKFLKATVSFKELQIVLHSSSEAFLNLKRCSSLLHNIQEIFFFLKKNILVSILPIFHPVRS